MPPCPQECYYPPTSDSRSARAPGLIARSAPGNIPRTAGSFSWISKSCCPCAGDGNEPVTFGLRISGGFSTLGGPARKGVRFLDANGSHLRLALSGAANGVKAQAPTQVKTGITVAERLSQIGSLYTS